MVDYVLIDTLKFKGETLASHWKDLIRKSSALTHYNQIDDDGLVMMEAPLFPQLARVLERGMDRSILGGFFVTLGKDRMRRGFPMSEIIYAVNLCQQMILEYMMSEFAMDNPVEMYQGMSLVGKVSEFFILGCYYISKGFLEETFTHMKGKEKIPEELLKRYLRDDFFFKKT
jgi:hypothetical protein